MKPHSAASGNNVVYIDHTNSSGEAPPQSTADPIAISTLIRDSFFITNLVFVSTQAEVDESVG